MSASPSPRAIFKFNDGTRDVFRDPFELHRCWFEATEGNPLSLLRDVQPPLPQIVVMPDGKQVEQTPDESDEAYLGRMVAYDKLIVAARKAFELAPVDRATGAGVPDNDVMRILNEWTDWQEDVKKKPAPLPTSAAPSTFIPKTAIAPQKKSSDCGCSHPESGTSAPPT